jgi:hypothetical protein
MLPRTPQNLTGSHRCHAATAKRTRAACTGSPWNGPVRLMSLQQQEQMLIVPLVIAKC